MERQLRQRLDHLAEILKGQFEQRKGWVLWGLSVLYLGITCWLASRKLMWNDELFTFYIARLPSLADIWSALSTGADQIPPFFHILTRTSWPLLGVNHVSVRLPGILGFWVMSLCLFRFVSKRSLALYGFAAMLFPLLTTAYDYAYEARPYGAVLGFSALALLCWQSVADGYRRKLWLAGLSVSVAAAISSHYYAVLVLFPLAVGEMVRSFSQRHLDLAVWGAFVIGVTPLLLFLPLIEAARAYSAHFWAQPRWGSIAEFYYFLLIPAAFPLAAILIFAGVYRTPSPPRFNRADHPSRPTPPVHEIAAALGFVVMPAIAVILAKLVTGGFTYRYALPSVIGVSVLLAVGAYRLFSTRGMLPVVLIIIFVASFFMLQIRSLQRIIAVSHELGSAYALIRSEPETDLSIIPSDLHTFMILAHYAPTDITSRLLYLANPDASLRYLGHTTVDRGILDLQSWFKVRVEKYQSYIHNQSRFLVLANDKHLNIRPGGLSWLLAELISPERYIELRGQRSGYLLFLVSPTE